MAEDYQNLLYDYSMKMLGQDMLTNSLFMGSSVGKSLRDMVLARQPVQPLTNPFDEAMTGTLRGDAAAVRQNSRNVAEAASMMGTAKSAVAQISNALSDMEDIIDSINEGELSASSAVVQADYEALRDKVTGLVSGTDYNGIAMLDSSQWGTDQIDATGNVWIQAFKDGGFNVTFNALDTKNWSGLDGGDLETDLSGQLALVQSLASDIDAVLDQYSSKVSSLDYQQTQLESQATILDQAVEARRQDPTLSAEQALLNLILAGSGSLLNESG